MSSSIRSDEVSGDPPRLMEEGTASLRGSMRLPRAPQLAIVHLGEWPSPDPSQLAAHVRQPQSNARAVAQVAHDTPVTVHDAGRVHESSPVHDGGTVRDIGSVSVHGADALRDTGTAHDASTVDETGAVHGTGDKSGRVRASLLTRVFKTTAVASVAVIAMWALGSVLFPNAQKEDVQHHGLSMFAATGPEGANVQREADPSDNSRAEQSATPVPTIEQAAYVVASANPAAQPQPQQGLSDQQRSQPQQGLNDQQRPQPQQGLNDEQRSQPQQGLNDQQQPQPQQRLDQQSQQSRPQQNAQRSLSKEEIARLTNLGEKFLAQGDVATARRLLEHAAQARDPRAALTLGATYDPDGLRRMGIVGIRPDLQQAHLWYTRAAEFGSREASQRLAALAHLSR